MKQENFGQRMARERREMHRRLYGALRRDHQNTVWFYPNPDLEMVGAVKALNAAGYKAEMQWQDGKLKLLAVRYEAA